MPAFATSTRVDADLHPGGATSPLRRHQIASTIATSPTMRHVIPRPRVLPKWPAVLGVGEVEAVLAALGTHRQRAIVLTLYGAGLRVSEALALAVHDIDSARMQIHVREAKGGGERYVPLSPRLLGELHAYWRRYRPSRRHLQHAYSRRVARRRALRHQGRPRDHPRTRRIPPASAAPRAASGLHEDPPLRRADRGQRPRTARACEGTARRETGVGADASDACAADDRRAPARHPRLRSARLLAVSRPGDVPRASGRCGRARAERHVMITPVYAPLPCSRPASSRRLA